MACLPGSSCCFCWNVFNSLAPGHRTLSSLVKVMACCLTTLSHSLTQCWLIISEVLWLHLKAFCVLKISICWKKRTHLWVNTHHPGVNELIWSCLWRLNLAFNNDIWICNNSRWHRGCHYWYYYPGTLTLNQVTKSLKLISRFDYTLPPTPVSSFTKEVNPRLAKCPLVFNGRLANCGLTSLVKEGPD